MEETYDPEGIAIVSEETEEEQKVSKTPEEGEAAGVKGTLLQKMEATSPQTQGESHLRKRTIRNYEGSKKSKILKFLQEVLKNKCSGIS